MTAEPQPTDGLHASPAPVALVTGAGSGIGRATAVEFSRRGYRVAASDLDPEAARTTTKELSDAIHVELDVTDLDSVERGVEQTLSWGGRIDTLVNNAGVIVPGKLVEVAPHDWERAFSVNVHGVYHCCRTVLPSMLSDGRGAIVNVASAAGLVGVKERAAYCASKGAVVSMTKALALDHIRDGIRVNCVCPGTVDTPWTRSVIARSADPEATREDLVARQPMGRLGTVEEIAHAIAYLASDEAAYVTGSALVIDGGLLAG